MAKVRCALVALRLGCQPAPPAPERLKAGAGRASPPSPGRASGPAQTPLPSSGRRRGAQAPTFRRGGRGPSALLLGGRAGTCGARRRPGGARHPAARAPERAPRTPAQEPAPRAASPPTEAALLPGAARPAAARPWVGPAARPRRREAEGRRKGGRAPVAGRARGDSAPHQTENRKGSFQREGSRAFGKKNFVGFVLFLR